MAAEWRSTPPHCFESHRIQEKRFSCQVQLSLLPTRGKGSEGQIVWRSALLAQVHREGGHWRKYWWVDILLFKGGQMLKIKYKVSWNASKMSLKTHKQSDMDLILCWVINVLGIVCHSKMITYHCLSCFSVLIGCLHGTRCGSVESHERPNSGV